MFSEKNTCDETSQDKNNDIDIKDVITRIGKLHTKEKIHILNILNMANVEFTKNTNGYFFNFIQVDSQVMEKICNCLELIEKNAGILKEMDRRRSELLKYYKNLIEERIQNNIKRKREEYTKRLVIKNVEKDIKLSIRRKNKINWNKTYCDNTVDPDILIKEYTKLKYKYEKDSVYHRIITSIKLLKSNRSREVKRDDDDEEINTSNQDNESGYDNIKDDESVIETEDSYNESNDIDNKSIDEDDNDNLDTEEEKTEKLLCEDIEEDHQEIDNENEEEDKTEIDFLYFKNILNQQGFQFDDNKNCLLTYQSYID